MASQKGTAQIFRQGPLIDKERGKMTADRSTRLRVFASWPCACSQNCSPPLDGAHKSQGITIPTHMHGRVGLCRDKWSRMCQRARKTSTCAGCLSQETCKAQSACGASEKDLGNVIEIERESRGEGVRESGLVIGRSEAERIRRGRGREESESA